MKSSWEDTIAAVATPPGRGGVGVIRVSGPAVETLLEPLLGSMPAPRKAIFTSFRSADGKRLDQGIALYFPGPQSFTGESVLELHAHGNPVLLDLLLARLFELGCRPARPGEFTERAFLNNKIDLAQAEAVADLINAETHRGVQAATRSLDGEFSKRIHALVEACIQLRLFVEAAIDFTDEDIDFLSDAGVEKKLTDLGSDLDSVLSASRQGALLREGMTLALAGKPNAGKSSLLNLLAGRESAIVTPIAGTTRDSLREHIELEGVPVHIVDTAGLRMDTDDLIEKEGIRRAREAFDKADQIIVVVDDRHPEDLIEITQELPKGRSYLCVRNKIDLSGNAPGVTETAHGIEIRVSVKTQAGIEALKRHLLNQTEQTGTGDGLFMARRRHLDALMGAQKEIALGSASLRNKSPELLAEHLRGAQEHLSEITGEFTSDDLLGRIFSSFCIGK